MSLPPERQFVGKREGGWGGEGGGKGLGREGGGKDKKREGGRFSSWRF